MTPSVRKMAALAPLLIAFVSLDVSAAIVPRNPETPPHHSSPFRLSQPPTSAGLPNQADFPLSPTHSFGQSQPPTGPPRQAYPFLVPQPPTPPELYSLEQHPFYRLPPAALRSLPPHYDCPARNGLFRHPQDCGLFISCANSIGCVMPCPEGLRFDNQLKVCVWPFNTVCDDSSYVDPAPIFCDDMHNAVEGVTTTTQRPTNPLVPTQKPTCTCPNQEHKEKPVALPQVDPKPTNSPISTVTTNKTPVISGNPTTGGKVSPVVIGNYPHDPNTVTENPTTEGKIPTTTTEKNDEPIKPMEVVIGTSTETSKETSTENSTEPVGTGETSRPIGEETSTNVGECGLSGDCCAKLIRQIATDPGLYEMIKEYYTNKNNRNNIHGSNGYTRMVDVPNYGIRHSSMAQQMFPTAASSSQQPPVGQFNSFESQSPLNQYQPSFVAPNNIPHQMFQGQPHFTVPSSFSQRSNRNQGQFLTPNNIPQSVHQTQNSVSPRDNNPRYIGAEQYGGFYKNINAPVDNRIAFEMPNRSPDYFNQQYFGAQLH